MSSQLHLVGDTTALPNNFYRLDPNTSPIPCVLLAALDLSSQFAHMGIVVISTSPVTP